MLKMNIPQLAVENRMRQDGKDPDLLINYLENGGSIDPEPAQIEIESISSKKTKEEQNSQSVDTINTIAGAVTSVKSVTDSKVESVIVKNEGKKSEEIKEQKQNDGEPPE